MSYKVIAGEGHLPIKGWFDGVPVEDEAMQQLRNVASMPFVHKHVAAMPDTHWGMGATVGSVIPTRGAIIPAAVGVDLGCGMNAARLDLTASDLPDNLHGVRTAIEASIPHGRTNNGGKGDRGAWGEPPRAVQTAWEARLEGFTEIVEKHPKIAQSNNLHHLATLGTGNHFIEVCLDEQDHVWLMLHSGSRGVGNRIGSYFIEFAKQDMKKWFVNLPDVNLAYFPEGTEHFRDYVEAVGWAQDFAAANRELMMRMATEALARALGRDLRPVDAVISCHHNYVEMESHFGANVWVTRKGAVRARTGDRGIIPGSMGARSYIVRGKGNRDSFRSCSHGAGRKMSRGKARRTFTVEDHEKATAGVECRKDEGVLDETPGAYKDIDTVMAAQRDLVEVEHTLKAVVCVKG